MHTVKHADGQPGIYSGNLLNWATTSKYDLLEDILVGGISTSRQTHVNTLISKSNTWQKTLTYTDSNGATRTCIFNINNANVEVTESTPNACGYLDSPAHPIPNDPGAGVAFIGSDERFALDSNQQKENYRTVNSVEAPTPETPGILSKILSAIVDFLVPSAEASQLRISPQASNSNNPKSLTDGTECTAGYTYSLSASGGTAPYAWSWVATGSSTTTPPGLTLVSSPPSGATISGTPTTSGTYYFSVTVTDSQSGVASVTLRVINTSSGASAGTFKTSGRGDTWSTTLQGSSFAVGGYRIQVLAIDNARNSTGYKDTRSTFTVQLPCIT